MRIFHCASRWRVFVSADLRNNARDTQHVITRVVTFPALLHAQFRPCYALGIVLGEHIYLLQVTFHKKKNIEYKKEIYRA